MFFLSSDNFELFFVQPLENTYRIHSAQGCQVPKKIEKAKSSKMKKGQIFFKNLLEFHKILQILVRFLQNRLQNMLFSSTFNKAKKWPNHFNSGKLFQKRPNMDHFTFKKPIWQPCFSPRYFFFKTAILH